MKSNPRVVFDTNIFISALIFGGNPRTCLDLAIERTVQLVISRAILLELSQKLQNKFGWASEDVADVIEGIGKFAQVIKLTSKIKIIKTYPKDNIILECAESGNADFIVSGDKKHILSLGRFKKIQIVSAKEFLDFYYKTSKTRRT